MLLFAYNYEAETCQKKLAVILTTCGQRLIVCISAHCREPEVIPQKYKKCILKEYNQNSYSLTRGGMRLAPAYDFLSTTLVIPEDHEESALTINGKKNRLKRSDFIALAEYVSISEKVYLKIFKKFIDLKSRMDAIIDNGRLPDDMKISLKELIETKIRVISG